MPNNRVNQTAGSAAALRAKSVAPLVTLTVIFGKKMMTKKQKEKLTPAQKEAKRKMKREYMTIFINGKQKRVKRPPAIDGMNVDDFIREDADPIWLHQNGLWEYMVDDDESDPF